MKRISLLFAASVAIAACLLWMAPARADSTTVDVLRRLVSAYGVSGAEGPVRREIESMLPSWAHPKTDAMGNLVLEVGHGAPSMLFIAHMDEIGYYVTDITPDGYLRVEPAGGFWPGTFEGRLVLIHTDKGDVPGVVGTVGTLLGQAHVNIAGLDLGRDRAGGSALSLFAVDGPVPSTVLDQLKTMPAIISASLLKL